MAKIITVLIDENGDQSVDLVAIRAGAALLFRKPLKMH